MISAGEVWRQIVTGPGLMDSVCNFIIRPPRSDYEIDDLGPDVFRVGDTGTQRYDRTDFELENMRGMNMQCSWYRPLPEQVGGRRPKQPCVVYCHANCGGRYDGLEALYLLEKGFTLFTFDFCGSGMSDGEYISLGFYERQDLAVVVEFLHSKTLEVDGVGLWGRSMGAVTSVMYAAKDIGVRCIVCDSPFASLRVLIHDLVEQHGGRVGQMMPNSVVNLIVERIRKRIAKRAAFDIDDLDTVKYATLCRVPALLFHGDEDVFVSPKQSMAVRDNFAGPCLHELTPGGHNDERDENMQEFIAAFFRLYMIEKPRGEREMREQRANQAQPQQRKEETRKSNATAASPFSSPSPFPSPTAAPKATHTAAAAAASPSPSPSLMESTAGEPAQRPAFATVEEYKPKMRQAHRDCEDVTGELGTGQTGPISFTKPRMRIADPRRATGSSGASPSSPKAE